MCSDSILLALANVLFFEKVEIFLCHKKYTWKKYSVAESKFNRNE
jgi:hypothetical protein